MQGTLFVLRRIVANSSPMTVCSEEVAAAIVLESNAKREESHYMRLNHFGKKILDLGQGNAEPVW